MKIQIIHKLAGRIYDRQKRFFQSDSVREDLKTLYPAQDIMKKQREFAIEKLSLGLLILLLGTFLAIVMMIKELGESTVEYDRLQRRPYGEGADRVELSAKSREETAQISLEIGERSFTEKELTEMYSGFLTELIKTVLDKNTSFDELSYDMVLPESIEGYPFLIGWQTDGEYIGTKGELLCAKLKEPAVTELTADITYREFTKQEIFLCCVRSRASPPSMQAQLQKRLQELEEESREEEFFLLPTEYEGNKIIWKRQTGKNSLLFLLAIPGICLMLCFGKDRDLHKRVEEREEQMRMDYPKLVSKLALLLGAGMTVQNAWNKMAADYDEKKKKEHVRRYAYEEMTLTMHELRSGVYQSEALENFGRRCRLACYNKLTALLVQNLRSGSSNLALLLQEEAVDAFEERKHMARRQGEKAGTKLLFPMMLLLMVVMIMILVPGFLSNMG